MKKFICSLLLLAGLSVGAQSTNCVLMVWNPSSEPGIYKFYHSTNMTIPLTNWTIIAECESTVTNLPIAILPGVHYFYLTFSNWWGESVPSNVVSTPPAPLPPTLRIERIENP